MIGQSHDYKRNGTTTLFAALEVATGQVTGRHYKRRRRLEFLDFMNRMVTLYQGNEIHVILDNLSTHKPKRDRWLARHPNVHFHYTPTHASWLNQIEIWFSILSAKSLKGGSFASVPQPSHRHRYQGCATENQHTRWLRHRHRRLTMWCTAVGIACWHERDRRVAPDARRCLCAGECDRQPASNLLGRQWAEYRRQWCAWNAH